MVGDIGINNFEFGIVSYKSSVSFDESLFGNFHEVFEGGDLFNVYSISFKLRCLKVFFEFVKEFHNFSGGRSIGEILSDGDEGFS